MIRLISFIWVPIKIWVGHNHVECWSPEKVLWNALNPRFQVVGQWHLSKDIQKRTFYTMLTYFIEKLQELLHFSVSIEQPYHSNYWKTISAIILFINQKNEIPSYLWRLSNSKITNLKQMEKKISSLFTDNLILPRELMSLPWISCQMVN